jgi:radical SAM superfamily enzyme YgiQ (UPF0313 family)
MIAQKLYQGTVIRPPSEANSLIIQITLGCSDNGCTFCPAYKDKTFTIKNINEIEDEIKYLAEKYPLTRRIFFADGDAITIGQDKLKQIFELTNKHFPYLSRIALYGSIKSLKPKSVEDLQELKKLKLGLVYLGFETGSDDVYDRINKFGSPAENVEACLKIKAAGIKTNVTVILGLGGKEFTEKHAIRTAKILSVAKPDQIAALTLMLAPGTKLHDMSLTGKFIELNDFEFLVELKTMIETMEDFRCQFFSNHASNFYQIAARFPSQKPQVLEELDHILKTKNPGLLTPNFLRGL